MKHVTHSDSDPALPLPAWAWWADIFTLVLIAVALLVAAFGGVRFRTFGARLSLTSPGRLLMWALAITVVRHVVVRQDPVYRRLVAAVRSGIRTTVFGIAWPVVVGTRLPVLLVGYFAVVIIGYGYRTPEGTRTSEIPNRVSSNEWLNLPSRWDTGWYVDIASYGYKWNRQRQPREQQNIVFFPAYPFLMRLVGRLIGSRMLVGGMLVTFAAFFVALIYMYGLARQWLDHEQAVTALWLLASYPFALFFSAVYTESLFLCGALATFFHFHRREYMKAGLWGTLVGLTRPNGFLLSVPLAILALQQHFSGQGAVGRGQKSSAPNRLLAVGHGPPPRADFMTDGGPLQSSPGPPKGGHHDRHEARSALVALAAAAMPGIGMLLYSTFIYHLTGDPLAWARGHIAWGREYTGLSGVLVSRYLHIANEGFYEYTASIPLDVLNVAAVLFVLGMSWFVFSRFGLAYALFLLLNLIPPLLAGGLVSSGRFTSVLFPVFFALALLVSPRMRPVWIAAFAMGQALNAALFFTWRELF